MLVPLSKTSLKETMEFIENKFVPEEKVFFQLLKKQFTDNQDWSDAYGKNSEFNLQKFFHSLLCKTGEQEVDTVNLKRLQILAVYSCNQKSETADYRKALLILKESCHIDQPELMNQSNFLEITSLICRMASIDIMQAAVESNYMQELYKPIQYKNLLQT